MFLVKQVLKAVGSFLRGIDSWAREIDQTKDTIYGEKNEDNTAPEIHSLWDFLKFKENTQAFHLTSVVGFEEWVSMKEIRRRIKELFGIEYQNDRSLYPYVKTLVDAGLFEIQNTERVRKWRKKDLLIKLKKEKEKESKKEIILAKEEKKKGK